MVPAILDLTSVNDQTPVKIDAGEPVILSVSSVLAWVAPGAPRPDALKFLLACRSAKLNPLLGEAYLIPMGKDEFGNSKWSTVVSKAGYLKRAQQNPDYDGHESGLVIQQGPHIIEVPGAIRPDAWKAIGGWAKVYRKATSHPTYVRIGFDEYGKQTRTWKLLPLTMITKCALVGAIREAFGIGDSYDESETDREVSTGAAMPPSATMQLTQPAADVIDAEVVDVTPPQTSYRTSDAIGYVKPEMVAEITSLLDRCDATAGERAEMLGSRNVSRLDDLTVAQAEEVLVTLRAWDTAAQAQAVFGGAGDVEVPDVTRKQ